MKISTDRSDSLKSQLNTLKTLSDIGREITSTLDMEKILFTIYKKVNKLMDATIFGIGLYYPEKKHIEYKFAIAENKKYKPYTRDTKDKNQFPVWCIENKKAVFINDVKKEFKKYLKKDPFIGRELKLEDGSNEKIVHSLLYQPIIVKKKVIGIISVQSYKRNAYTSYHLDILQNIASYAGMAIENAEQFHSIEAKVNERTADIIRQQKEIEVSHRNTKLLSNIGREIAASLSVKEILQKTYKNVNKLMDANSFGIAIYEKETDRLNFICNIEKGKPLPFHYVDIKKDNRPAAWCFNNQKVVIMNDFLNDYKKYGLNKPKGALAGAFTHSIIYLPLTSKNKKIGVITVQSFERNAYTEYHLDIIKNLAVYVVNAIDNAQLFQNMEQEVKARTIEITNQKEEIEKAYQNTKLISDIGREMTSTLDMEKILFTAYKKVNKLMDATIFGIGLYHPQRKCIDYKFAIAENKRYKPYSRDTKDKNQFPVWCIEKKKPIFISDVTKEYKKYFKKNPIKQRELEDGSKEKIVLSLLYQPIIVKEKVIGIITVQSYKMNAYNSNHLDILQSIASYAGMAIENSEQYHEILKQKQEVEKSYQITKLLSDIGNEMTSTLDMEKVLFTAYKKVNKLMDATIFGIGLYRPEKKCIEYKLAIEENKKYKPYTRDINDKNQFPVWCIENQKPVFINDVKKEFKNYLKKLNADTGELEDGSINKVVHSLMYQPIIVKKKLVGIITVQSYKKNAYSLHHLDILQNIASYAGMAIENAEQFHNIEEKVIERTSDIVRQQKEIEKSHQNTKILSDIGREIASSLSVKEIIQKTYTNVNKLMDANSFGIALYDKETNRLNFISNIERGKPIPFHFVDIEKDVHRPAVWCFKNQKEVLMNDFLNDYKKYSLNKPVDALSGEFTHSIIYLPLSSKEKQIGVITTQSFNRGAYTEYHLDILKNLAVYVVNALENARLYQNMESEVKSRTAEVVKQKEEIERSYHNTKLLSDIGREITASLSVEEITEKVYKSVNTLMNASVFAIGVYEEDRNQICFPGDIENGEKLAICYEDLSDETRASVWCFKNQKPMIINDFKKEYNNYFPGQIIPTPLVGASPESLIYLPLSTATKKLGVITVQSFKKNAYTEYHLNILRNLAIYIVIALENARLYGNMEAEVKLRTAEIEKQKEELEKLSIVASETDNAVIIAGPDGEIQWVNAGFTRITGYTLKELMEKRGANLMEISGNPKIKELIKDCIEKRKFVMYEILNKTIDGRDVWFQTMLTPILGKNGEVRNLVTIDSDITKLKHIEMEMRSQNEIILEKNKHITDSINYAKRIQDAILPSTEVINNILPESFVLFKPKDIVSGDFYWITEKKGKLFFAVVDCTGHGVPGAFVSIIGHNGLYRAVNEFGLTQPSEILDKLNDLVEETFRQNNTTQINDGMDIALCSYDKNTQTLEFAGANNPLYYISNGVLSEIKGDKQPIGAFDNRKSFTNHSIELKKNDSVYVFSDGYADQFGGESGKKFKYNKFKDVLLSLQTTSMVEQGEILNDTISIWMEGFEQLDDICVIGMKV